MFALIFRKFDSFLSGIGSLWFQVELQQSFWCLRLMNEQYDAQIWLALQLLSQKGFLMICLDTCKWVLFSASSQISIHKNNQLHIMIGAPCVCYIGLHYNSKGRRGLHHNSKGRRGLHYNSKDRWGLHYDTTERSGLHYDNGLYYDTKERRGLYKYTTEGRGLLYGNKERRG